MLVLVMASSSSGKYLQKQSQPLRGGIDFIFLVLAYLGVQVASYLTVQLMVCGSCTHFVNEQTGGRVAQVERKFRDTLLYLNL